LKPRLIYAQSALRDLQRLQDFLRTKSPEAASRARDVLLEALGTLQHLPEAHRPVADMAGQREMVIKFGATGYVARYHYKRGEDVIVLFIKHQRELGYSV
jgi:plasmid stabilization system protein ParE